jgi:hypothetical protein
MEIFLLFFSGMSNYFIKSEVFEIIAIKTGVFGSSEAKTFAPINLFVDYSEKLNYKVRQA